VAPITSADRLRAAVQGEVADRPPIALWRHFPVDDEDPAALAASAVGFQRQFDLDLVKVTPASSYSVADWGARDEWRGDPEGTRDYTAMPVVEPEDWRDLPPLAGDGGKLAEHLGCLRAACAEAGPEVPVLATVFSPLAQAKHLAGEERLFSHLHRSPEAVEAGLETIARRTAAFVEAAREAGIAGIFYAIQHATYGHFDETSYTRFGEPYDRRILEAAGSLWLNLLHLHGQDVMFGLAARYPVQVVNWHDRHTPPSLSEAKRRFRGAVCGGLRRWESLVLGGPADVMREAREAVQSVGGRGMILGAGCVVPVLAPRVNLAAARRALDFA
jgi:uroporphyrinogen decarboxylase